MKEKNPGILKRKVTELPGYIPPSGLWDKIENNLSFNLVLDGNLERLPSYIPGDKIWDNIQAALTPNDKNVKVHSRKRAILWLSSSIAASIMLFLLVRSFHAPYGNKEETLYTEEVSYGEAEIPPDRKVEDQAIDFIKAQCRAKGSLCSTPELRDKINELDQLGIQLNKLAEMERQSGSSETMIKSQIKLVNFRSQLIKELISNLSS